MSIVEHFGKMRVPLVGGSEWDLRAIPAMAGSVSPAALSLFDLDGDGTDEVVLGTTEGILVVIKPTQRTPWAVVTGLSTVYAVVVGNVFGYVRAVAVICLEGKFKVWTAIPGGTLELRMSYNVGPNLIAVCTVRGPKDTLDVVCATLDRRIHVYTRGDGPPGPDGDEVIQRQEVPVPYQVFSMCESVQVPGVVLLGTSHGWSTLSLATGAVKDYPLHSTRVPTALAQLRDHVVVMSEDGTVALHRLWAEEDGSLGVARVWEVLLGKVLVLRPVLFTDGAGAMTAMVVGWSGDATVIGADARCVECSVSEPATSLMMSHGPASAPDLFVVTFNKILIFRNLAASALRAFSSGPINFSKVVEGYLTSEQRARLYDLVPGGPTKNVEGLRKLLHGTYL